MYSTKTWNLINFIVNFRFEERFPPKVWKNNNNNNKTFLMTAYAKLASTTLPVQISSYFHFAPTCHVWGA